MLTLPGPAWSAEGERPTIAVLTFDVEKGISADDAAILADRLAVEIDRKGAYKLINRSRMAELLELQKYSRLDSCSAVDCAVEAGRILNARYMVFGSIGKVGDTWSLNTYMVDVESGTIRQSASTDERGGLERLLTAGLAHNAALLTAEPVAGAGQMLPTCAVLTFDARGGISADETRLFSDRFQIEMDSLRAYRLVPRAKMEEVLQQQNFTRSESCSAQECAIEAGRLLGVQFMAYGTIGRLGSLFTINTYMVNVQSSVAEKTATTDFSGTKEAMLTEGMRLAARTLLGIEEQQGYLDLSVYPAAARLTVADAEVRPGRIPVAARAPLVVRAVAEGYRPEERQITVEPGEVKRVNLQLAEIFVRRAAEPVPRASALPGGTPAAPKKTEDKPPVRPRVH